MEYGGLGYITRVSNNYFWYDHTFRSTGKRKWEFRKAGNLRQLTSSLRRQPVYRIISLSLWPHLSTQGEGGGSVQSNAIGINVDDADLDRGMVFGGDQSV